jgi:uncharacterized protein YbjT (DUF2867 family)
VAPTLTRQEKATQPTTFAVCCLNRHIELCHHNKIMSKKKVVICGITGSQGGWVYEALKDDPTVDIVGFSRNVQGAREKLGDTVELQTGDLTDIASLQTIFQGADHVFGMSQPWNKDYTHADVKSEVLQGKNIIQACLDAKVQHLVFSSAWNEGIETGTPHLDSKVEIERCIKKSGLNYTILHPVQYADNVGLPFLPVQADGWIRGFVDHDAKVPYISCRDIGKVARCILQTPTKYQGQTLPLFGDLVSGDDLAGILSDLRGETIRYYAIPRLLLRLLSKEFYLMRVSFETFGRDPKQLADAQEAIVKLRKTVPDLSTMRDHLTREGWATRALVSKKEKEDAERTKAQLGVLLVVGAGIAAAATVVLRNRQRL